MCFLDGGLVILGVDGAVSLRQFCFSISQKATNIRQYLDLLPNVSMN